MHTLNIIHFILVGISLVNSSPAPSAFRPSRTHFSTEAANKAAPFYDLSDFGINSGQLPKVYDISNGSFTYLPDDSYNVFLELKAGLRNQTALAPAPKPRGIEERACEAISLQLIGPCGVFSYSTSCVDSTHCVHAATGCYWTYVIIWSVGKSYITFWTSGSCNGSKGSINPTCDSNLSQSCYLNHNFASFRAYNGCHEQYSDDGCN